MKKLIVLSFLLFASSAFAATDNFSYFTTGLKEPVIDAVAVTPSDVTDLTYMTRRIYVGGAGDVTVVMKSGNTITFKAVPTGTVLEVRVSRIKATGTTATNIVALY